MTPPADSPFTLPSPTAEAMAHSTRLADYICREATRQGGRLGFDQFMELALYAPALGYYTGGLTKFGAAGDFITAPEISPLFARCLANQCTQVLAQIPQTSLLEFGAGSGILAADLLLTLETLNSLPDHYYILELSSELQARQRNTLKHKAPHLADRVQWLQSLPPSFTGIVIANEVMDAMPVHRFIMTEQGPQELFVVCGENGFAWQAGPLSPQLKQALAHLPDLPPGYRSEINLHARAWIRSLADMLNRGVILLIDYGYPRQEYYHPQRRDGTLQCHYQHRAHDDPFICPGLQDITAHVDFTAIAETGLSRDLDLMGFTNQASFLIGAGLEQFAGEVQTDDPQRQVELAQAIRKLTLPGEMGEAFKVMALGKAINGPLMGFQFNDQRWRLGLT